MKLKGLLLIGFSAGLLGFGQMTTVEANVPWLNISDKSVPRTDVVDISSHNGTISVNQFKSMKSYGVKGVMVKLTEATSYRNPYAYSQVANARAAGLIVGGYHYSWYTSTSSARAEGQYFAQFARELGLPTNAPMADDLEESQIASQNSGGRVNANVQAFKAGVQSMGYTNPVLYTGQYYIDQTGLNANAYGKKKMWMAAYPFTPSKNNLWHTDYGMWQFSSNMHFPGISGAFDANIDYSGMITRKPAGKVVKPTNVGKYYTFNQTKRNDGMYSTAPYGYGDAVFSRRAPKDGSVVWVEKQEKASNGVVWYLANVNGEMLWFDSKAGTIRNASEESRIAVNAPFEFNQKNRKDALYISGPYGYAGSTYVSRPTHGVKVLINEKFTRDGVTWFRGSVNGKSVWFDARATIPMQLKTTPVNKYVKFEQENRNDGLYLHTPYGEFGNKFIGRAPKDGSVVWISKQFVNASGVVWYNAEVNGQSVWFDAKAVQASSVAEMSIQEVNLDYVFYQTNRNDSLYATAPYGFANTKYAGKAVNGTEVHVSKKFTKDGVTWMYGSVNGQNVWFDGKAVTVAPLKTNALKKYVKFEQKNRNDTLYLNAPYGEFGNKALARVPKDGSVVWVTETFVNKAGVVWYKTNINNQNVWFDAKAGALATPESMGLVVLDEDYVFDQINRKDSLYSNSPYGYADSAYSAKATNGISVKVEQKYTHDGVTWMYGSVNGKKVWFDEKAVKLAKKTVISSDTNIETAQVSSKLETVNLNVDFVFDQTKRADKMYKNAPRGEKGSEVLRPIANGEVVHATAQYVAADGTIWYNATVNGESVWFEVAAGRIKA